MWGISLPPHLTLPRLPSPGTVPTAAGSVMNWGQELVVWCYCCSEPWSLLLTYVCLFHRATLLCQIPPEPKSDPEKRALCGARISQRRAGIIHQHLAGWDSCLDGQELGSNCLYLAIGIRGKSQENDWSCRLWTCQVHIRLKLMLIMEWPQPFPYQDCIPPPFLHRISAIELGPLPVSKRWSWLTFWWSSRKRLCSFISSSQQRQYMKDPSGQRGYELKLYALTIAWEER